MRRKQEWHGDTSNGKVSRLYRIWRGILGRCTNPNDKNFSDYGGRGVLVDSDWLKCFSAFKAWATGNGYDDTLTIDRIDVNGHYEPGNCRWVTMRVQAGNKRNNKNMEIGGVTKTVKAWADELGIPFKTLYYRHENGASAEEFTSRDRLPTPSRNMIEIDGVSKNAREWAEISGVPMRTIYYRINHGVTGKDILGPSKNIPKNR